jgi:hypothetical protein
LSSPPPKTELPPGPQQKNLLAEKKNERDTVELKPVKCIGCNSTSTVVIDNHPERDYVVRQCRSCSKKFKVPR